MSTNASPSVLVVLANGVEELEAVAPIDLLRRAGAQVTLASLADSPTVQSKENVTLIAESPLRDLPAGKLFDMVFLPGGPGVAHLRADARIKDILLAHKAAGKWIAAICAAPLVLLDAGLLNGVRYTGYPTCVDELKEMTHQPVEADGKILTGRGPGVAILFGLLLVEKLFSPDTARALSEDICLP